jgi:hypothetical protein
MENKKDSKEAVVYEVEIGHYDESLKYWDVTANTVEEAKSILESVLEEEGIFYNYMYVDYAN